MAYDEARRPQRRDMLHQMMEECKAEATASALKMTAWVALRDWADSSAQSLRKGGRIQMPSSEVLENTKAKDIVDLLEDYPELRFVKV